jgi:RimJ/RimL family protein N-acetyltransferase
LLLVCPPPPAFHTGARRTISRDERAIACYRNAGFAEEGLMRDAAYIGGRWLDVVLMAVLKPPGRDV